MFAGTVRHCRRYGGVEVLDSEVGGGPAAVAGWVPADALDPGALDLARSGLWLTPLWLGPQATVRLERHERPAQERLLAQRRPGDGYLWVLGAHPQAQGRGVGAAALRAALTAMAAAGHDRCLLRTDDAPNVPWYERQGFAVVEHLDDLESGLPAWILARPLP